MKRYYIFRFLVVALLVALIVFNSLNGRAIGVLIGAVTGFIGGGVSYFLFRNEIYQRLGAGIIFIVIYFGTNHYLMPYYYAATFETTLKETIPNLNVIATYYPKEYNEAMAKVKNNIIEHRESENLIIARNLNNDITEKSVPLASNEAVYNYYKLVYEVDKKLYLVNPIFVLARTYPARIPSPLPQLPAVTSIYESSLPATFQALENVIKSGAKEKSAKKFTAAEIEIITEDFKQIGTALLEKYGEEVIKDTFFATTPFKDTTKSAQVILSMYELIFAKGEEEGGLLIKSMFMPMPATDKENGN